MNLEKFMRRCFELAQKGAGFVSPNPLVGAVIVKNNKIISEGWHQGYGFEHAEVNAIKSMEDQSELEGSTLFVNLEPCSHYGKTPPCCELIANYGFKEVIISNRDPNPLVAGKGIAYLEKNGIKVIDGVLEKEGLWLNRYFFKTIVEKSPYLIMKMALTMDGFLARQNGDSKWITNEESRKDVHLTRSKVDAIMVGRRTAEKDDPKLNVRLTDGRNPFRIVIDPSLSLNKELNLFSDELSSKTFVIYDEKLAPETSVVMLKQTGVNLIKTKSKDSIINLKPVFKNLYEKHKIASIVVEGGSSLFTILLEQKLFDEAQIYSAPVIWGDGKKPFYKELDDFEFDLVEIEQFGADVKKTYKINYSKGKD